jgi:hypothetical protein
MKKILISGPVLSRSGYGEMARFAYRSLKHREDVELYISPTSWGSTGWLFENDEERKHIDELAVKTINYAQQSGNNPKYDISIQITIPNEWKKLAAVNIGYTAGIETNIISPAWLQPSQEMDKIIVISHHAKTAFDNTVFGNAQGQQFKVSVPIEVVHLPYRNVEKQPLDLSLKHDFNFLSVCQWGGRKNLEQTIVGFLEEFKNEEVGLVLKVNSVNDSIIDRTQTQTRLKNLLESYPNRKCSITLLHGHLSDGQVQSLYVHPKIKAIVSTTHGEGYGLPLMEAAANELPVIATDWSAHKEFLYMPDEDGKSLKRMFGKVDYDLKKVAKEHVWKGVIEENSEWAYPKMPSYKEKLREIYKDYGRFKSQAKKLAPYVRDMMNETKLQNSFSVQVAGENEMKVTVEELPKVSIITSVFKADKYIKGFLEDITKQTIFKDKCELILINANSPGNEEEVIKQYMEKYPNIVYKKLDSDPGIYGVWNMAIKMASGEYITNANVDDKKFPTFMEEMAKRLYISKNVDLVYANNLITSNPEETWDNNKATQLYSSEEFSLEAMLRGNPPHCMPMWRKSLHETNGYFEEKYRSASDWEFWLRCVFNGSKFSKIDKILGLYFFNPEGMSTNQENTSWKREEEKEVFRKYMDLYQERNK